MNDTFTITLNSSSIQQQEGVVVLDVAKYQALQARLEEYRKKEALARNVNAFEELASWGNTFARERGITETDVLEHD